ncbi:hypothetical protein NQ318_010772 [Aromia moschata]|uniref:Uncharacterized protein n=1 Tax=Aromia moschata TaxID=1265417 RepID=A0AAV8Z099_9CUCU|nr:hypothetical protein NQ318_010772 [Aromia moschata]
MNCIPIGNLFLNQPFQKHCSVFMKLEVFIINQTVKHRPKSGRPVSVTNEENSLNVMLDVVENPINSTQQRAVNHNMSRYSIQKICKREKFHPYKIHMLQELSEDDFDHGKWGPGEKHLFTVFKNTKF